MRKGCPICERQQAVLVGWFSKAPGELFKQVKMDKENWKSLKHSTTNSISVTTTETDRNGTQYDVDVLAECHFN
jgi:hypothetical protein